MRAFITGVEGFAGKHLASYLLESGLHVSGSYFKKEDLPGLPRAVQLFDCDVRNSRVLLNILDSVRPDQIFHLAAQSSAKSSFEEPGLTFEVNTLGTLNLLQAVWELGINAKILLVSSCEVYGEVESAARENSPLNPLNPYASSKASAELIAKQYHRSFNLRAVTVRPFNHTGPGQSPLFALPSFARQIAEIEKGLKEPCLSVGNLEVRRDFLDVRDVIKAYRLVAQRGEDGEVYNISTGNPYSIRKLLEILLRFSAKKIEVRVDEQRMRPADALLLSGDPTKLIRATGWHPEIPLEETLKDLLQFWRQRV